MEANQTIEGPQATKDAKDHPSLKDPDPEDLYEANTHETPSQLSDSQKHFQPPEVHLETFTSLNPDTKGSEDLWDPSVSETLLKSGISGLLSPSPQISLQSVTSLEKAIAEIPLEELAFETLVSEVQEKPLEVPSRANIPEYETLIPEVPKEPLEVSPTANIPEYETLISKVPKELPEGSPTANIPEYETLITEVQKELPEGSPTANIPEYETLIPKVPKEPLEGSPTTSVPEFSHELTSDTIPQTQVPESEHFQKQSFSEPSTQAKEDTPTKEGETGEAELTVGTSKITAAKSAVHAKKKKEKRAGATSRPVVPAKRAELVEVAKAVHREQSDDQVNNLFQWEKNSALKAIQTGIYIGWRCPHYLWDCFRIGDESKCFCGHLLREHQIISDLSVPCGVSQCRCLMFCFIPSRPEEVGEFWLKKRATFDPKAWRAQCRCKHTHEEHAATGAHPCRHRGCFCSSFESNFLCAACDRRWEEHETFFETEETRRRGKRPYGINTVKNWHRPF
ncbi:protein FAM221B [Apodemus sylvaticus]|uniref:protein FAM221B n=1 Tax=Apodemus sylvaticus TaxID=10129 RepID=UPI0022442EAB|nr:protein FAM221B [Apodemus sylvaticus]